MFKKLADMLTRRTNSHLINSEKEIIKKYPNIKSVIHVGGCHCQEFVVYDAKGLRSLFVEPIPEMVTLAKQKYPSINIFEYALCDVDDDEVVFNVTSDNNIGSSSLLELDEHSRHHPDVLHEKNITVRTMTLDSLVKKIGWVPELLVLDTQGSEGAIIDGGCETLSNSDLQYIFTEVNFSSMYKGCILWPDLKTKIESFGFEKVAHDRWFEKYEALAQQQGNALFKRI
ncbi:MAG: FkbM family methyltransferase [Candidatus Sedimenticola sp. (ex Thyasira tokunagai)]